MENRVDKIYNKIYDIGCWILDNFNDASIERAIGALVDKSHKEK